MDDAHPGLQLGAGFAAGRVYTGMELSGSSHAVVAGIFTESKVSYAGKPA